jgi:FkbH-like protein
VRAELADLPDVAVYTSDQVTTLYPDAAECDAAAERLGHVPYTPLAFTALGTLAARAVYAVSRPSHKVIVVDCDNTLWKGVCAEDGPSGVSLDGAHLALQAFLVEQHGRGRLVCLCSKNDEADVFAVFRSRSDFLLQEDHLSAWRVSWEPKPVSLKALAQELSVGLDSVVFIDDSPIECFEVASACSDATVVQFPGDEVAARRVLNHLWCLDARPTTSEDRRRGAMYREQAQRVQYRQEATSFEAFIAGLQLQVAINPIGAEDVARAAQLTERTNQFNFSTIRRSESAIRHALETGALRFWGVRVSDRFGDYGLVGLLGFAVEANAIAVDTFLLSCRALGRGVEHRMLAALGQAALDRGLSRVEIPWVKTTRNAPALKFAGETGAQPGSDGSATGAISLDAAAAAGIRFVPAGGETPQARLGFTGTGRSARTDPRMLAEIARELSDPREVLRRMTRETESAVSSGRETPPDDVTEVVRQIWAECLARPVTRVSDGFFDLGGTSFAAVQVAARLVHEFGLDLSLADVLSRPTVEGLADFVSRSKATRARSAIPRLPRRVARAGAGSTWDPQAETHD